MSNQAWTVIAIAWGVAAATVGCASQPPQPTTMTDPQANFSAYRTFAFDERGRADGSGQQQPLSMLDSNIRAAISAQLQGKGYEQAPAGATPDLLIGYEKAKADTIKSNPIRIGVGVGSWGGSSGGGVSASSAGARNVTEGTLVIHAVDPAREAAVWEGRVTRELDKGNADPAVVQSAVAEVFRDFPARSGQP
jgi:hypothetical protein